VRWLGAVWVVVLAPAVSFALDGEVWNEGAGAMEAVSNARLWTDTIWTLLAAILVFLMQAGFALVESGFTRAKNAANIMMKNLMDFSMGSLAYWLVGFGLMFGNGNALFGMTGFMVSPDTGALYDALRFTSVPTLVAWFFQLVFAATAATIVSGAMAERTNFACYLAYSFVITLLFYPLVGHWIWGGGWLSTLGMLDFAGSTVVHSTGGWFALAGTIVLGPRIGKYAADGTPRGMPGHSLTLATLGTFLLWFGWFGFNPGSTMGATDPATIGLAAATTNLAAASGAIGATLTVWLVLGKPDLGMALNGALSGLVAVTCACAYVEPWVAIVFFGFVPGIVVVLSVLAFDRMGIDDPVGAISVHGVSGALGTLLLGLFHTDAGLIYGHGIALLYAQAIGVAAVFSFCFLSGLMLFRTLDRLFGLRVSAEEERIGLDLGEHGNIAHPEWEVPAFDVGPRAAQPRRAAG
jgi:Amt family ammonium transporter